MLTVTGSFRGPAALGNYALRIVSKPRLARDSARIARLSRHDVALALRLGHQRLREPTPLRLSLDHRRNNLLCCLPVRALRAAYVPRMLDRRQVSHVCAYRGNRGPKGAHVSSRNE